MLNFNFYSPTYFEFGTDTESKAGELVKRFGGTKVLLHYGKNSVIKSGLLGRVKASLDKENIGYVELGGVQPNPRDTLVYEGIELSRKEKVDFILAVGGGSVIDSSKAIALGVPYSGDFWDFYSYKVDATETLPVGTVLTIAAAGSEGSESSVITRTSTDTKNGYSNDITRPKFSILNPQLTCTLPSYQTAAGAIDIMAHVFERYFSNTPNVETTDRLCEAVLLSMVSEVPKAIKNPDDVDARANIMWAGMVAHNNIVGVGREQDWNSHGIEHQLSAVYDVAHGAGLAVIFPAWMTYLVKEKEYGIMRFAQIAVRLWGVQMNFSNPKETALKGIECFKQFLSSIGMPINFEQLGAKAEDIPLLVKKFGLVENETTGGFYNLNSKDVENIYNTALLLF
ncbi:MAG: iron-containing alcohol dehydrogenase [Oscillospiraceae bacterium]|jgi:alcohol dehydrogenase YqhD (iron-dependent ADH family)|nr:iron-containing alcohol dehydrogenase [Oscillospiraceae bacterium]